MVEKKEVCFYQVKSKDWTMGLPDNYGSKEEAREALEKANKRERDKGYKETQFIVVEVLSSAVWDENGFISKCTQSRKVD